MKTIFAVFVLLFAMVSTLNVPVQPQVLRQVRVQALPVAPAVRRAVQVVRVQAPVARPAVRVVRVQAVPAVPVARPVRVVRVQAAPVQIVRPVARPAVIHQTLSVIHPVSIIRTQPARVVASHAVLSG